MHASEIASRLVQCVAHAPHPRAYAHSVRAWVRSATALRVRTYVCMRGACTYVCAMCTYVCMYIRLASYKRNVSVAC